MVIPLHIWGHALRIWLAAVTALYVAFWLQLGGASSAAVTVAILAQPTRGAALAKAANRIAATFIGAAMSIVIAGLFPGERVGLLAAFILWMCVCVFVGSYFRGFRAMPRLVRPTPSESLRSSISIRRKRCSQR